MTYIRQTQPERQGNAQLIQIIVQPYESKYF